MAAGPAGAIEVGRGPFTPGRFGLFSVAEIEEAVDVHWQNGVWFPVDECNAPLDIAQAPCPVPGEITQKSARQGLDYAAADPFTVYASMRCSPAGVTASEALAATDRRVTSGEQWAVERALWTGIGPTSVPYLSSTAGPTFDSSGRLLQPGLSIPVTGGSAQSLVQGMATLEQALANCYTGTGVIHASPALTTALYASRLIDRQGSRMETGVGTPVVVGKGYPGTGPNNSLPPPGQQWAFATGPVRVWRSPVWHPGENDREMLARATNDRIARSERTYVVSIECCIIAVLIDLEP